MKFAKVHFFKAVRENDTFMEEVLAKRGDSQATKEYAFEALCNTLCVDMHSLGECAADVTNQFAKYATGYDDYLFSMFIDGFWLYRRMIQQNGSELTNLGMKELTAAHDRFVKTVGIQGENYESEINKIIPMDVFSLCVQQRSALTLCRYLSRPIPELRTNFPLSEKEMQIGGIGAAMMVNGFCQAMYA